MQWIWPNDRLGQLAGFSVICGAFSTGELPAPRVPFLKHREGCQLKQDTPALMQNWRRGTNLSGMYFLLSCGKERAPARAYSRPPSPGCLVWTQSFSSLRGLPKHTPGLPLLICTPSTLLAPSQSTYPPARITPQTIMEAPRRPL